MTHLDDTYVGAGEHDENVATGAAERIAEAATAQVVILQFARALDFAAKKHVDQKRKGEPKEPYINHLTDVTRLLATATEGRDTVLVLAGLLHDTIEDTETTFDELVAGVRPRSGGAGRRGQRRQDPG